MQQKKLQLVHTSRGVQNTTKSTNHTEYSFASQLKPQSTEPTARLHHRKIGKGQAGTGHKIGGAELSIEADVSRREVQM